MPFTPEEVAAALERIPGWRAADDAKSLRRTYAFPTFPAAIAFVDLVAVLAEAADHHPDIDVRYAKVTLTLSTHSEGGVTEKDLDLIRQIDQGD